MRNYRRFAGLICLATALVCWHACAGYAPASDEAAGAKKTAESEGAEKEEVGGNDFDNAHANAGPNQGSIIEIKSEMALYSFIVFLLLLAVVGKFAWKPIMEGLEKREHSIAAMIDDAKQSSDKAHQALQQYEARLAEAARETSEMLAKARLDAEAAKDKIIAEAQAAAHRERDKSLAEIRTAKEVALREMAQKSVDTAFAIATRIIHKELRPADHAALIKESMGQFPSNN